MRGLGDSQPTPLLPEYSFQCIGSPLSHFCSGLGQFPGSCLLESCVWEGLYIHTWAQWFSIWQHCTLRKLMEMHEDLSEDCWNNGLEDSSSILAPGSGMLSVLKCMGHPYMLPQMLGVTLLLEKHCSSKLGHKNPILTKWYILEPPFCLSESLYGAWVTWEESSICHLCPSAQTISILTADAISDPLNGICDIVDSN